MIEFLKSFWYLTTEMAPYLLLGFFLAGVMHVLFPKGLLLKHLSKPGWGSVWKAALIGVPLPLCSCGVIPVAAKLDKEGASKGASLSFLTSTPSTGVDSILATWGMLGPFFTIVRSLYSLVTGLIAGLIANTLDPKTALATPIDLNAPSLKEHLKTLQFKTAIKDIFEYGFVELLRDAKKWLLIGLLVGAGLGVLIPQSWYASLADNTFLSYFAMLAFGLPLYVCATGSIPIAASLASQGLSAGALLIFLTVGPATNTATLAFVREKMGNKIFALYLLTLSLTAIATGFVLDLWNPQLLQQVSGHHHAESTNLLKSLSAIILLIGLLRFYIPKAKPKGAFMELKIPAMMCSGCASSIEKIVRAIPGVEGVDFVIDAKTVRVSGTVERSTIVQALSTSPYPVVE